MKVLLVGSGGREAALAWALSRSSELRLLRCAPGNAGISRHAERVPIGADDVEGLVRHATTEAYDLVVVGPEAPLVAGLSDRLQEAGIDVFGPTRSTARLEGSKAFAKRFLSRHGIPTAAYRVFEDPAESTRYLLSESPSYPLVVKADGLAAGKGVVIAKDPEEAVEAAEAMLSGRGFGDAGRTVVVEEMLRGREASFFVLTDGERGVELAPCQDYKRALDGDAGPNTGGMGTYSPSRHLDEATRRRVTREIVEPTLRGLSADRLPYRGVIFIGLMLTAEGPKVLEYNVRFGDPETQVLLPRLDGEWLPLLASCARGTLRSTLPRFRDDATVCVVMASGGYPASYEKGKRIDGISEAESIDGVTVFHAGTELDAEGHVVTAGGRVLGITATGASLLEARTRAYDGVSRIRWDGEHHRSDVAGDA